jgi:hypothetical protein
MTQVSLPRQLFFALAAETPVVVLAGQAYLCDGVEPSADRLLFDGQPYGLVPLARLSELEELYAQAFAAELQLYRFHCLQGDIAQMQQLFAEEQVVRFLRTRMIPLVRAMRRWRGLPEQEPLVAEAPNDEMPEPTSLLTDMQLLGSGLLTMVLGEDALILDDKVYHLTIHAREEQCDPLIYFQGRLYCSSCLSSCRFLWEVEEQFNQLLSATLRAVTEAQAVARSQELQRRREHLYALGRYQEDGLLYLYRDDHAGIVRFEESWWVYLEVPEFVLMDYNEPGAFYHFGQTRVGVPLSFNWGTGQVDFQPPAQVLTPGYEHPYTGDGSDRTICMGSYDWSWRSGRSVEEAIYQYLLDARVTLLRGYHPYNRNTPRRKLEAMPHRRISWERVQQFNLPVTNSP